MQPSARIILSVDGKDKSYFLWNGTEVYYKKLRYAYLDIINDRNSEYLYFSFFTLCAATLEYSLNFTLTDFCLQEFGLEEYKQKAKDYIRLPLGVKLKQLTEIVSQGEFAMDETCCSYIALLELITLRNRILHNKEFLNEFDFSIVLEEEKREQVDFQIEVEPNYIETLTKDKCILFGKALGEFKQYIMTPALTHELKRNSMVKEI